MTTVTPRNILRHELIGLDVDVVKSSNDCQSSVSGRIVDESRNILMIKQGEKVKRIAKQDALFNFRFPEGCVEVEGSALVGRPEDRVKKKSKRRW